MKSVQVVYNGGMAKRVEVKTDLTAEELQKRYRQTTDAVERTHWHISWQAKEGKTPREVAELLGYTARWVRTIMQRWNAEGEAGIRDHRRDIDGSKRWLSAHRRQGLGAAPQAPPATAGPRRRPRLSPCMQ